MGGGGGGGGGGWGTTKKKSPERKLNIARTNSKTSKVKN